MLVPKGLYNPSFQKKTKQQKLFRPRLQHNPFLCTPNAQFARSGPHLTKKLLNTLFCTLPPPS